MPKILQDAQTSPPRDQQLSAMVTPASGINKRHSGFQPLEAAAATTYARPDS